MKKLYYLFFLLSFVFTFGQEIVVSGIISDKKTREPIPAIITTNNKNKETQADIDGKYSIIASKNDTLVFKFIGMKTQKIKADKNEINVDFQEDGIIVKEKYEHPIKRKPKQPNLIKPKEIKKSKKSNKINPNDLHDGKRFSFDENYKIDTLKNKQVIIKNLFNKRILPATFDSIQFNNYFVIVFKKQKTIIYNYLLQKLKLPNLKTARLDKYLKYVQIIQNNELKKINVFGTKFKKGDVPFLSESNDNMPNSNEIMIKTYNKDEQFYLYSDYLLPLLRYIELQSLETSYKIYHTENVIDIEYNREFFTKINFRYGNKNPFLIYTKLKNGKYNLNTIEYLLSESPNIKIEQENANLPKDLDKITKSYSNSYLIEKDGLFTYYPLVKRIKYKSIGQFQELFARFELPNGQKGWLCIDGKEYLDE